MIIEACALVTYAAGLCSQNCGLDCRGYGPLNASSCGVCKNGIDTVHFLDFIPVDNVTRAGCHPSGECLLCPSNADVPVFIPSKTSVFLSVDCTRYVPSSTATGTISLEPGARRVLLQGPGTLHSLSWPLLPGAHFKVTNQLEFSPGNATDIEETAVRIQKNTRFEIDAVAPRFATLVAVNAKTAATIRLPASTVRGSAREVVLATAHVSGKIEVECTAGNQSILVQETRYDKLHLSFAGSLCSQLDVVNLASLLAVYGQQYDILFFEGSMPRHLKSIWKWAEYTWYVAGTMFLAFFLAHQKQITAFFTKHRLRYMQKRVGDTNFDEDVITGN